MMYFKPCAVERLSAYPYVGRLKLDANNFLGFSEIFLENLENVEIYLFINIYITFCAVRLSIHY